jgi:hypothetical protein
MFVSLCVGKIFDVPKFLRAYFPPQPATLACRFAGLMLVNATEICLSPCSSLATASAPIWEAHVVPDGGEFCDKPDTIVMI